MEIKIRHKVTDRSINPTYLSNIQSFNHYKTKKDEKSAVTCNIYG